MSENGKMIQDFKRSIWSGINTYNEFLIQNERNIIDKDRYKKLCEFNMTLVDTMIKLNTFSFDLVFDENKENSDENERDLEKNSFLEERNKLRASFISELNKFQIIQKEGSLAYSLTPNLQKDFVSFTPTAIIKDLRDPDEISVGIYRTKYGLIGVCGLNECKEKCHILTFHEVKSRERYCIVS